MKTNAYQRPNKPLRVIDFFCGAGGFSEGFRQQGFTIVMGIDKWKPAIDTHNLNHGLQDSIKDILEFWSENSADVKEIDKLPDTEFIIGSPSCISFSMSNKAGKADKSLGLGLIEAYLRVIAVKKHQKKSVLKGWLMENVPKSKEFIKERYSFLDLNLAKWAKANGHKPGDIAIVIQGAILNAGDYGAAQERKRYIVGEWVKTGEFLLPEKTHDVHVKSCDIRSKMPKPNTKELDRVWKDPNYPKLVLKTNEITDHFYDTGLYEIEWEKAEYLKTNHPFMGKMSFPENENRTCRTIIATRSGTTREPIIYKSEYDRKGNGEYRLPTIRELACLMGFPCAYQFVGSEGTKWRQVGNSVCPHMSAALAQTFRSKLGLGKKLAKDVDFSALKNNFSKVNNLNTFKEKVFNRPKGRKENARFRRHPIKLGNITVDLMNYHPERKDEIAKEWYVSVFFGTHEGHGMEVLNARHLKTIEKVLEKHFSKFGSFKKQIAEKASNGRELQKIYEEDLQLTNPKNPVKVVKTLAHKIQSYDISAKRIKIDNLFPKKEIPFAQLMAMYGLLSLVGRNNSLPSKL